VSGENVEVVRAVFAQWERGNFAATGLAPDVRIRWMDSVAGQRETVGIEEAADFRREWLSTFQDVRLIPERIIDATDKVLVIAAWSGEGTGSGARTEWRHGEVWEVRDSQVVSIISYADTAAAFEAAGLRE
jgi:ketosteroid isomerase-like protein